MKNKIVGIFVCTLLIATTVLPVSGIVMVEKSSTLTYDGNTLYVGGSGPGNYSTIQNAIDNASDGDTVFVYNDSSPYRENVVVNKTNNLIGEDKNTTIIDGTRSGHVVDIISNWVNISSFTIVGSRVNYAGISITVNYCNNTIYGNKITNNYRGIELWTANNNNILCNNISKNMERGIGFRHACRNNIIKDNIIWNHTMGIYLYTSINNTISGNIISKHYQGIYLYSSSNNYILGNNISGCDKGIFGYKSSNNNISGNNISSNFRDGIYFNFNNNYNNISGNTISLNNRDGIKIDGTNVGNNCSGNNLLNNKDAGISNSHCNGNTYTGNIILGNQYGIRLYDAGSSIFSDNTISNNKYGIHTKYSNFNNISGNNISSNLIDGINLYYYSSNNTVLGNIISNNKNGIYVYLNNNNNISNNIISSNNNIGINLSFTSNNTIYNNYFNNTNNTYDNGNNTWNITKKLGTNIIGGQYLGGNFWSDYTGVDNNGDGIGDTNLPYNSSGNITYGGDWLPLVNARPYPPSNPDPFNGSINVPIDANLSWSGGDPDQGDTVTYDVYFGITSPPPQVEWNQSETTYDPGTLDYMTTYYWQIVAWDNHGASNEGSIWSFTTTNNTPPNAPGIDGPTSGKAGDEYDYIFTSTDPEGHNVYYFVDWGDGTNTSWVGPFASGGPQTVSHIWSEQGTYTISAKAKDIFDAESGRSTLEVTMPRSKLLIKTLFLRFLEQFPNAFPILRQLLGL